MLCRPALALLALACTTAALDPWKNTSEPIEKRVHDLLGRLTLDEKLGMMNSNAVGVPRFGIANITWGNECLHGVVGHDPSVKTTVFPQPIGLAATFNLELLSEIGTAVGDEARALNNAGLGQEGLSCWSPNINLFRDPRWGRGSETYGEDPVLTGHLAAGYVAGIQQGQSNSSDSLDASTRYLKVVATPKHFSAYSLEEVNGISRHEFNAVFDEYDLRDSYLPMWEDVVQRGGAAAVMCSYNAINGTPACMSPRFLQNILRESLHFDGHVVSDCGAVDDMFKNHRTVDNVSVASADAVRAGTDLDCGGAYVAEGGVASALQHNLLTLADVDRAVGRTLTNRFRLGEFDPPAMVPWKKLGPETIGSQRHRELARKAASESLVLLKNDGILPLKLQQRHLKRVTVVGPHANISDLQLGNYHGTPFDDTLVTPLAGLQRLVGHGIDAIDYQEGSAVEGEGAWMFEQTVASARDSDLIIAFVGLSMQKTEGTQDATGIVRPAIEKESLDRTDLGLPQTQNDLVMALAKQTDTPIVVVLVNGGPVAVEALLEYPRISAVVEAWYAGQAAGDAIAQLLIGETAPSGRLPVTMYHAEYVHQIAMTDMRMRNGVGRGYRYLKVPPLLPFGYGLSYSNLTYSRLNSVRVSDGIRVTVDVTNHGPLATPHSLVAFVDLGPSDPATKRLAAFTKVELSVGETREVTLALDLETPSLRHALDAARPDMIRIHVGDLALDAVVAL